MSGNILNIEISKIIPNPSQPRHYFDEETISELSKSIKIYGLLQPIIVRPLNNDIFEIVAGERRYRACKILGLNDIPCIVREYESKDSSILALVENIQRNDLNFIEVAKGYAHLMDTYTMTQTQLSDVVGKSQSAIANKCRILELPDDILDTLSSNNLTERHARALLKVKDHPNIYKFVSYIIKNNLSVKKTEDYITRQLSLDSKTNNKGNAEIRRYLKDLRIYTNTLRQTVDMMNNSGIAAEYKIQEKDSKYTITIDIPIKTMEN